VNLVLKKILKVYDTINKHPDAPNLGPLITAVPKDKAVIEFHAIACAGNDKKTPLLYYIQTVTNLTSNMNKPTVPENVGKFPVTIVRSGRSDNSVSVR